MTLDIGLIFINGFFAITNLWIGAAFKSRMNLLSGIFSAVTAALLTVILVLA